MITCEENVSGENYGDFIYRHGNSSLDGLAGILGSDCFSYVNDEFVIFHVPLDQVPPISPQNYPYSTIPHLYGLLDSTSMEQAGILPTFRQPSLASRGEGTIIGFIDTGIDYQNPLFRNTDGSTRILGIWDQTVEGTPFELLDPVGFPYRFLYGTEFTETAINEALSSLTPLSVVPSEDSIGHGTFMASIAAGSTMEGEDFTGAAPSCYLGVVKLKPAKQYLREYYRIRDDATAYQSNDIMMGVIYLILLAYRYEMPLTICLGVGSNQGGHDGFSPLALVLNKLQIFLGVSVVCAAGNEAGRQHHYIGSISDSVSYDEVELRISEGGRGFDVELWANFPEVYTVGFVSPTGQAVDRIPLRMREESTVRFSLEQSSISVSYETIGGGQSSYLALMRFVDPAPGIWRIRVYPTVTVTGVYHMWLPIYGFVENGTAFLRADPFTTVTSPANAPFPITVSTYNHLNGSLYIHSSRGYTRDGRVKPDLAAPGVDVYGAGISSVPGIYPMVRSTGSSVAAAHTAGAVADLYSWGYVNGNEPYINHNTIKAYLTRGANRSSSYIYPNREWGYGTLDLYQSLLSLRN